MSEQETAVLITGEARLCFPWLAQMNPYRDNNPAYDCILNFGPKVKVNEAPWFVALKRAAGAAAVEKWGSDQSKWPKGLHTPFYDGANLADKNGFEEGDVYIKPSSKNRPPIVGPRKGPDDKFPVLDPDQAYAGCIVRASVRAFAWGGEQRHRGNNGVAFGLQSIQWIRHGEPLAGGGDPNKEFDDIPDADEIASPDFDGTATSGNTVTTPEDASALFE